MRGLSPFARGNHMGNPAGSLFTGPIPVRTGEPCCAAGTGCPTRAYPRSHGGTVFARSTAIDAWGLSPFARGNPPPGAAGVDFEGPIPVRTGEPHNNDNEQTRKGAYPRSHGGTSGRLYMPSSMAGLSPFARGNRASAQHLHHRVGPIPVRTGEPCGPGRRRGRRGAYPRSHGGTQVGVELAQHGQGLSPFARGNLLQQAGQVFGAGPIPVRTGEPAIHAGNNPL